MAATNRKVLLLVHNASSHKILRDLSNVTVHFLPPNMTSAVQPLDAGIIRSFKAKYRKLFVRWCLDVFEANLARKINVLEDVQFSIEAWAAVTPTTIANCWVKTRILNATLLGRTRAGGDYDQPVSSNDVEELEAMMSKWEGSVSANDYVVVDDEVDVHEPDVIVDDEEEKEEEEEEESQETVIQPAIALRHCLELSSFLLQCGAQTDSERRALSTVTALVRETTLKAKQQKTMRDFVM